MAKKHIPAERRSGSKEGRSSSDRQQRIAQRAYELHVAGGYRQGYDLEDWLEAERDIDRAA